MWYWLNLIATGICMGVGLILLDESLLYLKKEIRRRIHRLFRSLPSAVNIGKSLLIYYRYQGSDYQILVPFDLEQNAELLLYECYADYPDKAMDITNPPGIPYLITARDLDAPSLSLVHKANDKTYQFDRTTPKLLT